MESRSNSAPGCLNFAMFVLLLWGLAGWVLVFRPQIFGKWSPIQPAPTVAVAPAVSSDPAPKAGTVPAPTNAAPIASGSGYFAAVDGGILSVWKIGADGKATRVSWQPVLTPEEQGKVLAGTASKATQAYQNAAAQDGEAAP
jgi:hypothetical protein